MLDVDEHKRIVVKIQYYLLTAVLLISFCFFSCTSSFKWQSLNQSYGRVLDDGKENDQQVYNDLLRKSRVYGKPIFIDFFIKSCRPCKMMDREVYTQKSVSRYLNENFLCYKIDGEDFDGMGIAQRYNVKGYPTMIYIDSDGKELSRLEGYADADRLTSSARSALMRYQQQTACLVD